MYPIYQWWYLPMQSMDLLYQDTKYMVQIVIPINYAKASTREATPILL